MVHNLNAGTGTGSHTFNFTWAAPTSDIGDLTIYAAGVAANGNGSDTGDHVYKTSQLVTPAASTQVEEGNVQLRWNVLTLSGGNEMNITGSTAIAGNMGVQIFNLQGQVVWNEQNIAIPAGSVAHWMNVSSLAKEMYVVRVTLNDQEVLKQKFFN